MTHLHRRTSRLLATVSVSTVFLWTALATLTAGQAFAGVPVPDPPLGPPPPAPVPLSAGPAWHEPVRWALAGAGVAMALLLVVAAVLIARGGLRQSTGR